MTSESLISFSPHFLNNEARQFVPATVAFAPLINFVIVIAFGCYLTFLLLMFGSRALLLILGVVGVVIVAEIIDKRILSDTPGMGRNLELATLSEHVITAIDSGAKLYQVGSPGL